MSETDTLQTHEVTDIDSLPDGVATVAYYSGVPLRIEFVEPPDEEGVFRSIVVTYTGEDQQPWIIRALSKYGKVKLCAYEYTQFEGFTHVEIPDEFRHSENDKTANNIPVLADYMHDLLMFHRIDPPSANVVPS